MSDARSILRLYDHAKQHELPVVLATVVGTAGSTYRKRGARMMLCADGSRVGVVSGGCLEADVTRRAWFLKDVGEAELIRYDTGSGDDATYEFGLGCRGVVDIVVERLDLQQEPQIIRALRRAVERREASSFAMQLASLRRSNVPADSATIPPYEERIAPPTQLVIFGSGIDVTPLAAIADELGWSVAIVDHKLAATSRDGAVRRISARPSEWADGLVIDAQTACVLMTHRMRDDGAYLHDVLQTKAGFIGCLGPVSRTEALIDELAIVGMILTDADRQRIHAPVGLDLGAERPQDIALSILAEIVAAMNDADGGSLRDRTGPIHLANARRVLAGASVPR